MKNKIEAKGYWFLPDRPDNKVAGILTYIPKEEIGLELLGGFSDNLETLFSGKTYDVIHGFTSEGKKITLFHCFSSASLNFSSSFPITIYSCQYMLIGTHLNSIDDESFFKATVSFDELTYWCLPMVLEYTLEVDENRHLENFSISNKKSNENNDNTIANTQIDENTNILLKRNIYFDGSNFLLTPKIEQCTCLEIDKKKASSFIDFVSDIEMYEQFLSLATLKVVECSQIILHDRNLYQEVKGKKYYNTIELIYVQKDDFEESKQTKRHNYLFTYDTIEKQYNQIIKKWYTDTEKIAPIRLHLIESIRLKRIFSSVDFLIVIQALEGYHTRFRKKDTLTNKDQSTIDSALNTSKSKGKQLKERLNDIIAEFSSIDKIKNDEINVRAVVDSRHYYSHLMDKKEKKHAVDGVELYYLTQKLRKLLICCLLDFVGFDKSQINEILNTCHNTLLT